MNNIVKFGAEGVWVSTFHSLCVRILRRYIDRLGYDTHFIIYDSYDQKSVVKACLKRLNMDSKQYQERFRYIMVDEYQDTNHIQFLLIKQLASKYRNLCVVGDDDQSIYKFRGANIYNILNFEEEYP